MLLLTRAFVWTWTALSMIPFVFMLMTSLKSPGQALAIPPVWIFEPTFSNYADVLFGNRSLLPLVRNSVIVAVGATFLAILVGLPAAYALTMKQFTQRKNIGLWILSTIVMPPVVAVVPIFILAGRIGAMDTYWALIVPYAAFNLPMVIWILRSTLLQIPREIEEAAMIDGASKLRIFATILIPLMAPGLATAAIFCAVMCWNEFLFALTLTRQAAKTAPIGVLEFQGQYSTDWGGLTAASTVVILPVIVLVMVLRRQFVSGLTFGAVK